VRLVAFSVLPVLLAALHVRLDTGAKDRLRKAEVRLPHERRHVPASATDDTETAFRHSGAQPSAQNAAVKWELRPATDDDRPFLFDLMKASYSDHVVATWGSWDEPDQQRRFADRFARGVDRVILVEGERVGVLAVEEKRGELFLANIEIAPGWRGKGLGTAILRSVLDRARADGLAVTLQVLKVNRRAASLYKREGFEFVGETATHRLMRWSPAQ
jgi:ribosomal protein S18 acetylase RimI-like enzyme